MNITNSCNIISTESYAPYVVATMAIGIVGIVAHNILKENSILKSQNEILNNENARNKEKAKNYKKLNKKNEQDLKVLASEKDKLLIENGRLNERLDCKVKENKELHKKLDSQKPAEKGPITKTVDKMQQTNVVMGFVKGCFQVVTGKLFG